MALTIKHSKISDIPDGADESLIRPSDWNATHTFTGVLGIANGGTNATSAQGAIQQLLPAQAGQAGKVLGTDGTTTSWVANGGGGGAVTQIVAGTNITIDPPTGVGSVTINSSGGSTIIGQTQSVSPFETSVGFEAGNANTGVNNTYFGFQAGKAMTGATNNVVIGHQALDVATIPSNNVVIGSGAGTSTANINNCTIVGQNAAGTTTSLGTDNTLIGQDAGRTLTGASNIFIGVQCGNGATSINTAVCIGNGALGVATSAAAGTVAVGHNSFGGLTAGARNTAVGFSTGAASTVQNDNTYMGYNAGTLSTGGENTYIGSQSGDAAGAGTANTCVGFNSGTAITTGNNNTFVGRNAGGVVTTGSNNTIVGNYAGQSATMAGFVILADGSGNQRMTINNNGAVTFNNAVDFGSDGFVLQTRGVNAEPRWFNPNVASVAQFAVNVNMLPGIAVYFINCTTGNLTATLPNAAANTGLRITVKRVDQAAGNTLTVASAGGQIEGLATQQLGVSVAVQYCSDGTNWWELANS